MKRVFVDTSGFVALLVAEDPWHARGLELFTRAGAERWRLVTTNAVVIETYATLLLRARDGRRAAIAFLDSLNRTELRIKRIRRDDEEKAIAIVRAHEDKSYSLCDALSFAVMGRTGIREAIAFDRHFRQYGMDVLQ